MNYVYMDIPTVPGGPLADRVRARAIRAFYADYAIYRQLLLPDPSTWELRRTPTRGLHLYGGYAMDDEAFGVRVVYRRDAYGGVSLRGVGALRLHPAGHGAGLATPPRTAGARATTSCGCWTNRRSSASSARP